MWPVPIVRCAAHVKHTLDCEDLAQKRTYDVPVIFYTDDMLNDTLLDAEGSIQFLIKKMSSVALYLFFFTWPLEKLKLPRGLAPVACIIFPQLSLGRCGPGAWPESGTAWALGEPQINGWMMDGWMDGEWMDGWMDG